MFVKSLTLCLAAVALAGCAVNPKPPEPKPPTAFPTTTTSSLIELPVSVQYAFIEDTINQAVPDVLLNKTGQVFDCPLKKCTWQLIVRRNGRITATPTADGALLVRVPVRTEAGRIDAELFLAGEDPSAPKIAKDGPSPQASTHVDISVTVVAVPTVAVALNPNWSLNPNIQLEIEVQTADVVIKGYKVSVRGKLREAINNEKPKIVAGIVAAMEKINLRPPVDQAWQSLFGAYKVVDTPTAWVTFEPIKVLAENPKFTPAALKLGVGIESNLRTFVQASKPTTPAAQPLPDLVVVPQVQGAYRIALPIHVSMGSVNQALAPFIGKEFEFQIGSKMVQVEVLEGRVYANGPDLVVYVKAKAPRIVAGIFSLKVGAFINGTPYFDTGTRAVGLKDFDFDVNTNVLLLDKAAWFLHGKLKDEINKSMVFQVGGQLDTLKTSLAATLKKLPVSDRISVQGTVDNLSVKSIAITGDYLSVEAEASGKIAAVAE